MQRLYEESHSFDQVLYQLEAFMPFSSLPDLIVGTPFAFLFAAQQLQEYETIQLQFIIDHQADLAAASLESIEHVIDRFCHLEQLEPRAVNFFLHLADLLQRRLQAGETAAEALYDHIMGVVVSRRKIGQPRKRGPRK